jgi:hypothetical protein
LPRRKSAPQRGMIRTSVVQAGAARQPLDEKDAYSLEEKFFSFNPLDLFEDIGQVVDTYISDCADEMAAFMKEGGVNPSLADKGADEFVRCAFKSYDPNIDKFQMYCLRNLFTIPCHLQLQAHASPPTPAAESMCTESETDAELAALHAQLKKARKESALLKKHCIALDQSVQSFECGAEALLRSAAAFQKHGITNVGESMAKLMESFTEAQVLEKRADAISERLAAGPGAAGSQSTTMFRPRAERIRDADALAGCFRAHQVSMGGRSIQQLSSLNASLGIC